jgi:hypothetical protein
MAPCLHMEPRHIVELVVRFGLEAVASRPRPALFTSGRMGDHEVPSLVVLTHGLAVLSA